MKLYWSQEARARLRAIHAEVAKDAPMRAAASVQRLADRAAQLQTAPESGRRVPEYPEKPLRELLERPYRIIYRLTPTQIEIVTVYHYRQRLPDDL